jgi:deoxyribose-phosphate aldolase
MKTKITVADLENVATGGEVAVTPETLIPPTAWEEAERRGIVFRIVTSREREASNRVACGAGEVASRLVAIDANPRGLKLEEHIRLVTEQVQRFLAESRGASPAGSERNHICHQSDAEQFASGTPAAEDAGTERIVGIAGLIDHTLLKPEATHDEILRLCEEAAQFGFASVCVNPCYVSLAAESLRGTSVKVCTVVGFPLGATLPQVKIHEAEESIKLGAQEIDMVINIGALKSGQDDVLESDIRGVVEASHGGGAICKVILETALLTDEEKIRGSLACKKAGADFVKTSTGFSTAGATPEDVAQIRSVVGPEMGVKSAGGVRTLEDLKKMVRAGATRIGTSSGVKIMEQVRGDADASTAAADGPPEPLD